MTAYAVTFKRAQGRMGHREPVATEPVRPLPSRHAVRLLVSAAGYMPVYRCENPGCDFVGGLDTGIHHAVTNQYEVRRA